MPQKYEPGDAPIPWYERIIVILFFLAIPALGTYFSGLKKPLLPEHIRNSDIIPKIYDSTKAIDSLH